MASRTNRTHKQARLCNSSKLATGKEAAKETIATCLILKFAVFHKTRVVERVSIISWSMRSPAEAVNSLVTIHVTTVVCSTPITILSKAYSLRPLIFFNMVASKSEPLDLSRIRQMVKARYSIVKALN